MEFEQCYYNINHSKFFGDCGRIAYTKWGEGERILLCVHGLTRNSRDFDYLANNFTNNPTNNYQIICVDIAGRGKSDWLRNKSFYQYDEYVNDLLILLENLSYQSLDFLGTSMGGIIGILMASKYPQKISRLILNDIGAYTCGRAVTRTRDFLRNTLPLAGDEKGLRDILCRMCSTIGIVDAKHIGHFIKHSIVFDSSGMCRMHEDPAIIHNFGKNVQVMDSYDMWNMWDKIIAPTLIIRGKNSHILSLDVVNQMMRRGDNLITDMIEVDAGHAPSLMEPSHIQYIQNWLSSF